MGEVTTILQRIDCGDPQAADQLLPLLYNELRQLARRKLADEGPDHTLQATALVHEAYVRLTGGSRDVSWESRGHFFAAAAEAMRRILVESARRKRTQKHGGGHQRLHLDPEQIPTSDSPEYILMVNEALQKLATAHPPIAELVRLRYFAGLTLKDAGAVMGIPRRTADRYWAFAKSWLYLELTDDNPE
jgi:RNA polymerase sigma factor (TIGR02999 family)